MRGRRFYGAMPSLRASNHSDDSGCGQVIASTALDQYAATLAAWSGVSGSDIADIFPALERFERADLGFMA